MLDVIINNLMKFKRDKVSNYVIPGLSSYLLIDNGDKGKVRLFECSRDHQEPITPHDHRFSFTCCVIKGKVINRVWHKSGVGDEYMESTLDYNDMGSYEKNHGKSAWWVFEDSTYNKGDCYSMRASEIHSIYFSKGAQVLFFEGETQRKSSLILEPVVDGEVIPTFEVKPWMFKKARLQ